VLSSVTYILSNNIENLTLTGTGNINGTGNNLANTIIGNSGNNRLDGMGGADAMFGGAGNDTYIVDNIGGSVTEYANEGIDTVLSSVTFALGDNVENLTLTGNGGNSGFGNALDNVITGNSGANTLSGGDGNDMLDGGAGNDTLLGGNGNDILVGGAGNDFLMGGAGNDQFSFVAKAANGNSTAFSANNMGNDTILDFTAADNDQIVLSKTTFAALMSSVVGGALNVSDFASITGSDNSAANNTAHIVYNQSTGHLIYNQNGSASGFGLSTNVNNVTFATLAGNPTLTSTNFLVQV
jgi:Ca2+-binding RTX toxin-like protein